MSELKKAKPATVVHLGGKPRKLVYNLWAKAAIQEEKGKDFLTSIDYKALTVFEITVLLWACLLDGSPELDGGTQTERRKAQKLVTQWLEQLDDYSDVVEQLFKAILNSLPAQENSEQQDDNKKKLEGDPQKIPENSPS